MAKKKTTNTRSVSTSSIVRPKIISEQVSSSLGLSNSPSKSVSVDSSTLPTIDTSDRLLKVLVENDFKYDSDKLLKPIYLFKLDGKPEFNLIEFLRSIYSKKWPNAVIKSRDPPLKLITLTYLKLEKLKFSIEWIEKIMTEADPLSFSNCLDWALIFMDPSLLPTSLTDKYLHEDSVFDVKLIPRVLSPALALSNPNLETLPKESPIKSTSGTSELTNDMKSWILNSTDSGDDEKISEVIDKSKHSTLSTNSYYAKLKFDQYVLKSMEIKDENAIKEFKSVMESVIKSNRDYNPRLANDEYKKLLADYQLLNSSKKEKQPKNDEDVSVDNGEIFGDLFAQSNEPSVTSNTSLVLRDMSYKSWSGKNPKQYLVDYLSKNAKGTRAFFTILENGPGFRCKVLLSGGDKLVDGLKAEMDEKVATLREAEYYAATKVLFLLIPHLSVNLVLPNPYRILWSELLQNQASSVNNSEKTADDLRYEFCSSLVKQKEKIVKVTAAAKLFTDNSNSLREEANAKQSIFKALVENYPQRISCDSYMELLSSRKTLPVYAHRESVISAINSNAITLISGETGSGKSTQVPQFVLENALETSTICNIICTQPRRISALSIAERVSAEIGDVNGPGSRQSLVGYQIRLESKVCESTCLTFCTAGVLLRRLEGKGDLNGVTHVFVDEVHERSLESDFLLLLLKKLCLKRKDLKIILMSATSDAAKFLEYFKDKVPHYMEIPGRTFPVTSFFLEDAIKHCKYVIEPDSEFAHIQSEKRKTVFVDVSGKSGKSSKQRLEWEVDDDFEQEELYYEEQGISYDKAILKTLKRMDLNKVNLDLIESLVHYIHSAGSLDMLDDKPAILVFLPGLGEIKKLFDRLEFDSTRRKLTILPLHSVISTQDQARVFQRPPNGTRKVILSTNIAETGITIPDVGYVIDSCKSRDIGYDSHKHITRLSEVFISKANCLQRRGRAGRVREGICYHLIATYSFEKLETYKSPEIMRLPLEEMCLRIRASGTTDSILSFLTEAIDSPPTKNIERSIKELILVQALDENENLTLLGKVLSSLPVDVRLGKLLLYGVALKCLDPILTIASSLSISKTPFTRPFGNEQLADLSRDSFKSGDSDLLTIVSAFDQWRVVILKQGYSKAKKWCEGKFLSFQSFTQIEESRSQLIKLLASVEGVPSNINTIKRKGVIETSVLSDFNVNSSILRVLQTAIFAALNPNLLMLPTEPDAPKKFCLVQPHSLGYVYPSSQKSAYCNGVLDSPSCWFTFHSLTRVNTGTKSRLGVWDLTKITTMHLLLLSREFKVEHRQGVIEADGVRINCIARTAVCIARFKDILKETLERRIVGKSTLEDEKIVEMMIDLLKS